jgi:NAD(P)-dependent dehydrogenase (short-subunit alcohol dehydrogenase family)
MEIKKGDRFFITGAASGIGRAAALAVARRGGRLFLTDINAAGLEETAALAREAGGEVAASRALDISSYEAVKAFADEIQAAHGAMQVVMNIAGIALYAAVEDTTHRHWQKLIAVNLWGPIHGIECFLPGMIQARRGHIVTVSSASGIMGAPVHAAYAAAKFGLVGISEVLRYDLKRHNLGVTVVCPGAVDTPLKNTVEILGVDPNSPGVKTLKARFSGHAVSPERVAGQILRAIEKEQFLVITSFDIKLLYFLKRFVPPLYHYVMTRITNLLIKLLT